MENNEFNNINEMNETSANANAETSEVSPVADTQPIAFSSEPSEPATDYGDHYSAYSSSDVQQPIYTEAAANYSDPYTNPYASSQYAASTQIPYTADTYPAPPKKKSSAGKKVALIAGALALTLCVGIGGGFFGAYLAGNKDNLYTSQTSASQNSDNKNDSALQIIQASDTEVAPTTIQEVALKVKDSVVEITTETTTYDSFYGQYISQAAGSGVIISADGYILTNNHVIDGATSITVRLTNSKTYKAELIGKDATLDVALLKIDETDLTTAVFGDSSKLSVGQTAIAIGNPLGQLGGTVTDGIISALDREIEIDGKTMNLLQTNAAINPGNSGGGLFDSNGNLIGIVVAKSSSTSSGTSVEGLGFAIPVNDIIDILSDLKTKGYVSSRPYLGVNLVDITDESTMFMYRVDRAGVYVSSVTDGAAAKKAGIEVGDCITKINDKEVTSSSALKAELSKYKAGDTIKITVYRDGETKTLDVTLDEKTYDENSSAQDSTSGSGRNGYGGYGNYGGYGGYGGYNDFFGN